MQREFADVVQRLSEETGGEVPPQKLMDCFMEQYLKLTEPFEFIALKTEEDVKEDETRVELDFKYRGKEFHSVASGNGPIDAVKLAIKQQMRGIRIEEPVFMEYRWYEKNRRRDLDNISSFGRKVIQDALVQTHVLKNDGWKEIEGFSDEFFVDADNPRIEVLIREV